MVLQRRLASSLRAIRKSLERREEKLRQQLLELQRDPQAVRPVTLATLNLAGIGLDDEEPDDDEERWGEEDSALGVHMARTVQEFEIAEVHALALLARDAEEEALTHDSERKLAELRKVLQNPLGDGENMWQSGEKLLVFTENRDTLDYLIERFRSWGFKTTAIYGGMNQQDRRAA